MESLTKRNGSVKIIGENGVRSAKLPMVPNFYVLITGIILGLLIPLALDWALFGTVQPCHTVRLYEDGSSVQACEVRN